MRPRHLVAPWFVAVLALLMNGCGDDVASRASSRAESPRPRLVDAAEDCRACAARADIRALTLSTADRDGDGELTVELGAPPRDGDVIWTWPTAAPVAAVRFVRAGGRWRAAHPAAMRRIDPPRASEHGDRVTLELTKQASDGVAVTTGDGDRVPDQGFTRLAGGQLETTRLVGDAARRSERRVAQAQQGMERLDPLERQLGVHLLARQLLTGTFTYEGTKDGSPTRMTLVMDAPGQRSRQDEYDQPHGSFLLRTSLIANANEERFCSPRATRRHERCVIDRLDEEPATQVLAMQHGSAIMRVHPAPPRSVLGMRATCLVVEASVPDGPQLGERCVLADGALAYFSYVEFPRELMLVRRTPTYAESAFVMPRN